MSVLAPTAPAPARNWLEANARWILPLAVFTLTAVCAVLAWAVLWGLLSLARSTQPYKMAMLAVTADSRVTAALGTPVVDRFLVTGHFHVNGPSGRAEFALPIKGPIERATIYAVAVKSAGYWTFEELSVVVGRPPHERIDLLHEPTSSRMTKPNQTMQRTAGRSAFPLSMTSTFDPQPHAPSPAVADLVPR
jgi:hypothetical protein